MAISQRVNEHPRVPIGRISLHLQTSLYRKKGGLIEKVREYLKIGEIKDVFNIEDDFIEIQDGYFIKKVEEPQYTMTFGDIFVKGTNVKACSKNGIIRRTLKPGIKLKVVSFLLTSSDFTVYGINDNEFVSSDEDIQYISGNFEFNVDANVLIDGHTRKFRKGDILQYQEIEGNSILLLDDIWLDISSLNGTLHGC